MKGNLFIGFIALILPLMLMYFYWDVTKESLDCSSQYCKYAISDFFDNNKQIKNFSLSDVVSYETKIRQGKTRKGHIYTYNTYHIITKTNEITINKSFYKPFLEFYENPKSDLHLVKYLFLEYGFLFIISIFGLLNIICFFKPININIEESDIVRKIEEDGLIGLFNKKN